MKQHNTAAALTRRQVREVDRLAIESLGIPGMVLMENAARNAVDALARELIAKRDKHLSGVRVALLCGGGNNGGDGYAMARHLHSRGAMVTLFALKDPDALQGDARTNHAICERMGLAIEPTWDEPAVARAAARWGEADAVVDAMLGTGFTGEPREPTAGAIARLNGLRDRGGGDASPLVVAVDVPSGLDCDTGEAAAGAVRADLTVTFVAGKVGFAAAPGYVGAVVVADIGAPPELIDRVR